jgi:hypothetical protein
MSNVVPGYRQQMSGHRDPRPTLPRKREKARSSLSRASGGGSGWGCFRKGVAL